MRDGGQCLSVRKQHRETLREDRLEMVVWSYHECHTDVYSVGESVVRVA